ncbi:methyltransferase [Lactobacillus sp. S2-2]|uniref:tRNA1(Val) (adenine(37)-N6)-methyltransferase n=1 Tax=Lactobacillus sp. S2-2 TaxID=2692917 RepID=UPI001F363990|nr:tRNA1(Val) (adenine(37)-N6)-methyltransferase [Lactobacillus sp. S2-2]MCF6514935.1 methyltransferase [Lactobacillus sp. S2-2]
MTEIKLKENERIDQLYSQDIKIIQSDDVFSFSLDAVLLANFVKINQSAKNKIVDLCSGNGAVGLFVSNKTKGKITQVEIQPELADMAKRSVELNGLEQQINIINDDLSNTINYISKDSVDMVTVNPPYFPNQSNSKKNPNQHLAIARHEIKTDLHHVIKTASDLLKTGGKLYLVYRPDRLFELMSELNNNRLATKHIQFIYPKKDTEANMILVSAIKDGKNSGLIVDPPITVYDNGEYTKFMKKILYG